MPNKSDVESYKTLLDHYKLLGEEISRRAEAFTMEQRTKILNAKDIHDLQYDGKGELIV